ncbi:MAG: phosphatase PAP2 family protein [Caldimonas sp.]
MIVAAAVFGAIATNVATGGRSLAIDEEFSSWLHRYARPPLTTWMFIVTTLHSTVAVSCYAGVIGLWQARLGHWRRLTLLTVCLAGGLGLNVLMKLIFHRPRPVFDDPLLSLATYSFPSGHVVGSTLLYGLLVVWVFNRTALLRWRLPALFGAALAIALVGFSRVLLGVHYLSDTVAAFAEGVAWLALCLSVGSVFWRHGPRDTVTPFEARRQR